MTREQSIEQAIEVFSIRLDRLLETNDKSPESVAFSNERALKIAKAMEALPSLQREAIELQYWHQHSLQEIADLQQKSKSSVAGAIRRGLRTLQAELAE